MPFNTDYYHPMDRGYGESRTNDNSTNDIGVGIKDIGMSIVMGISAPNVQGIASKIRTGARQFEIEFPGAGRSQRNAQTPGVYGKLQRQAIEELSRVNQVDLTTHASMGVMGLAGQDQQGNFSEENRKAAVDEIKRAVEFARDVAKGGNVVVHTGEFRRPISEASWNKPGPDGKPQFQWYEEEPEEAIFRVVDDRTGQVATQVRKDRNVARPVWLRFDKKTNPELWEERKGSTYIDENGEEVKPDDYVDYQGNKIPRDERVPVFDADKRQFRTTYKTWEDFQEQAGELTEEARRFKREHPDSGDPAWQGSVWYRFRDVPASQIEVRPEEAYVLATLETNAAQARGFAYYYGGDFKRLQEMKKKLIKARKMYEKIEEGVPEEEEWKLKRKAGELAEGLVPPEYKKPTDLIDQEMAHIERQIAYGQEGGSSQWSQAKDTEETMRHIQSADNYALKKSYGAYAEAGMKAFMESDRLEKEGKLKKPIWVAMENIFPESYGGHPEELMGLVEGSRERMKQMLVKRGYDEKKAAEEAKEHIKAHIDTGHLNVWRKYWNDDPNKQPEQNDEEFKKWILNNVKKLADKDMVGSVHLADNYGYNDDHLSPGEGTTPVKEIVKVLKERGYKGPLIVEPGADASTDLSDFHGLMKTWRLFGSNIYGSGVTPGSVRRDRGWQDVQYGYFGQGQPPYFVFGQYVPSEDWTLWSGVKME